MANSEIQPNYYFVVFVFDTSTGTPLPPLPQVETKIKQTSTWHFREIDEGQRKKTMQLRVFDRIADITGATPQNPNPDTVADLSKSDVTGKPTNYEYRIVDLGDQQDNNDAAIRTRIAELEKNGYDRALHWRLVCTRIVE